VAKPYKPKGVVVTGTIFGANSYPGAGLPYSYNLEFQYLNTKNADACYPYIMDSMIFSTAHSSRDYVLTVLLGTTVLKTLTLQPNSSSQLIYSGLNIDLLPDTLYTIKLACTMGGQISLFKTDVYANSYLIVNGTAQPTWDIAVNMIGRWDKLTKSKIMSIY
jgi:hypothetical protein